MSGPRVLAAAAALAFAAARATALATPGASGEWSFNAAAAGYLVPDEADYVQGTLTADRGRLHLEGRYDYEDRDTGSIWLGLNLSAGEKWTLEFTPMLGGVFGHTQGIAPGYRFSLGYRALEFYSEGEYLFDAQDRSGNFFYGWSELTLSPAEWLRVGLVGQRTRAYQTELDIQRGLLFRLSREPVDFTAHVFNLGWDEPTFVVSVSMGF